MGNIRPLSQRDCHGDIKGLLALNQRLLLLEQGQEPGCSWKPVLYPDSSRQTLSDLRSMGSENWCQNASLIKKPVHYTAWKCVSNFLDLGSWAKWRQSPFKFASHFTTTSETPLPVSWQKFTKTWLWRNALFPRRTSPEKIKKTFLCGVQWHCKCHCTAHFSTQRGACFLPCCFQDTNPHII